MRERIGLTERLYFHDSYLWQFDASVVWRSDDGLSIVLDRTAFYPTSGGQPHDIGSIQDCSVLDVVDDNGTIAHSLSKPLPLEHSTVNCQIDASRRLDYMRQHSGQHLLSAVMEEEFGLKTVSFHMGATYATVDVEPQPASLSLLEQIEKRANDRLLENRPIQIAFEDAVSVQGLRKPPDREGIVRVVSIEGLDRSACGGTHVGRTGEIGLIALGKTEKVRKALRIEFYCGPRAFSFLRGKIAEADAQAGQAKSKLAEADKQRRKLAEELTAIHGKTRYSNTLPDSTGHFLWEESFPAFAEDLQSEMNSFLEGHASIALLTSVGDGRILFGAHPGLQMDCGKLLKGALTQLGGKGGGSPKSAQGTLGDPANLSMLKSMLIP